MVIVDEASGVDDKVFEVMEGALTEENVIVLMISNYTRNVGYFHNSQTKLQHLHQVFSFSSIDSPIPSDGYNEQIIALYGKESDQYRVRVLGLPPREEAIDKSGFVRLFSSKDINQVQPIHYNDTEDEFTQSKRMGVDPAGEGIDLSTIVIRDEFKAKIVLEEKISNPKQLARRIIALATLYKIKPHDIFIDMFGVGAEVVKELALSSYNTSSVTVGERPDLDEDKEIYINKRAVAYFRIKAWLRKGGELIQHSTWEEEAESIRYDRNLAGKMRIMSKKDMRANGYRSPNSMDALMLTFIEEESSQIIRTIALSSSNSSRHNKKDDDEEVLVSQNHSVSNPYSAI
jgi:hypothetical protein